MYPKEDMDKLNSVLQEHIQENAKKMVAKYNQRRNSHVYKVGDKVHVSAPSVGLKGKRNFQYLAEIVFVNLNFTYKAKWLTNGPLAEDIIDTESSHCVPF